MIFEGVTKFNGLGLPRRGSWLTKQNPNALPTKIKYFVSCNKYFANHITLQIEFIFFTATIHKWLQLLAEDNNQQLITDYLKKLCDEKLITVFAFVLMPNHVHFTCLPAGRFGNKIN